MLELVGRRLGEFAVREALSSGGFGMVFRAEQAALAREAVIKVMHTNLRASETLIQRFLREARLASRLDHPYAAHIYAFGAEPDGVLWIAMELVRGTPLDKLLAAQGPIPLERFVPLLERICQVVQTAHDQGIVHRDLKPGNVMVLARAGQLLPKLLDLGIAKLAEEDEPAMRKLRMPSPPVDHEDDGDAGAFAATATPLSEPLESGGGRLTEEGAIIGSPLYMAPEQWLDAAATDARTDIYALGILSYEALTGKPPFSGTTRYQIAMGHAQKEPPKLGGDLPPALDAVIARALAKQPSDRYGSALELAAAFRTASGLVDEPAALPRLPEDVRIAATARAPQPIAHAVSALETARNPHQARDAVWQLVRVAVRLVAVIALSAHAHVGGRADLRTTDAVRRLRRRALPDAEWLAIGRELVLPFTKLRDAYPIPELVDYLTGQAATPLTDLLALRDTSDGGGSDASVRELLSAAFPLVERMLAGLGFLADYRLVVPRETGAQLWMGVRRTEPAIVEVRGRAVASGQPALVDPNGLPVVTLWPFLQVHEPARGVGDRLLFLEGTGRRGARMIALPESFEHEDDQLWEAIGALADDAGITTSSQETSPFPGLSSFTAEDASRFFGRERETEELVNRLRAQPMIAVVGPSGAGKSSFVQAGVVPNLPDGWETVVLRPGAAPMVSLAARVARLGFDPATLRAELSARPASLGAMLHARGKGTVVIVVDQLEELFTLCDNPAERERFVEALLSAARTVDDPVRVVFTLRDDFLLKAEALPALRARLAPALILLTTPSRDELLRILSEPLRLAGYELDDPELAPQMVDALAGARSALALLSFTASKLWELRDRRFRQLTRKAYTSLGGIGGALARHAEATLEAMLPDEQRLVREVFRHAVTAEGTRAVLTRDELDQLLGDERHARAVIEKLVASRLLVSSEGPTGGEQIEITHEALIDAWPRLVVWRREDAEGVRLRDQLRATARQWDERGRPSGLLWRGDVLAEYRLWRARYPGTLTDLEVAFTTASLDDAARGVRRRRVALATSFGVLAAGVIALLVLNRRVDDQRAAAVDAKQDAEDKSKRLHDNLLESYGGQARQYLLAGDYPRALAYLDEAHKLGARGPAHDLVAAFIARGLTGKQRAFAHDSSVLDARFSPDGARLVTAGFDKRARIWNAADGRMIAELPHGDAVQSVRFLPDGSVLTASDDGTAVLWDGSTGGKLAVFDAHVPGVHLNLAVPSPDGQHVVTVTSDDAAWLWDRSGKLERKLRDAPAKDSHSDFVKACAFSPDGTRVAVGDHGGTLRVWDIRSGALLGQVAAHTAQLNSIVFSNDGTHALTASDDHTAIVWDVPSVTPALRLHHEAEVIAAVFSPDGKAIATASNDHTAKVWNAKTGERLLSLDGHIAGVNAIEYSPDGTQIATASDDSIVMLWDAGTGRVVSRLVGHGGSIFAIHYDATGARVVSASTDKTAIEWSAKPQLAATRLVGHTGRVLAAELAPDDHLVVTGGIDGTVRLWDRATAQQLRSLPHDGTLVSSATFSPDSARVATGNHSGIRLWDVATGRLEATLPGAEANELEWSRDGAKLLSASDDGAARVWSRDGKLLATMQGPGGVLRSASFSPAADRVITSSENHVTQIWDAASGRELARWQTPYDNPRFDPQGKLIVARTGLEAAVWRGDDKDHQLIAELKHDGQVMDVEWSSHGDFIVTASIDATVRIWDRAGNLLLKLGDGRTQWWRAQFSRDDRYLVTASASGVVVWELPRLPGSFEDLVRCKELQFVDNHVLPFKRPTDCT